MTLASTSADPQIKAQRPAPTTPAWDKGIQPIFETHTCVVERSVLASFR